jgi:UDP-GlcNAc:undecaprenyl-phosphate GlcNAc-1-phosphate transferase
VSTLAALAAFPAAALAVFVLLRSPIARRLRQTPESTRWQTAPTPLIGGIGIYLGFTLGLWLAVVLGPLTASTQLIGIYAGASLLFVAGLVDDLWSIPPAVKLLAQLAAAAIVMVTGTSVQIVDTPLIAIPLGLVWLVGMTNAFNLLDNMDGLAGSLAVISAAFFASAAALHNNSSELVLCVSLALALAVAAFLPFNLRPGRSAIAWMGDSGSQLIGFTLAALGLASSYTVASSTVATLVLPVLVLAVPILDTTLVTIVRLIDGRPVSQGGHDHSSHRLVSLGVSETGAVVLLALMSAALGATSLAYQAFNNGRVAALGVLVTFALLIQFGSFLADVDRTEQRRPLFAFSRRIAEVIVDGALIAASFLTAYLLRFDGVGTVNQRHFFLLTLPVLLFCRYVSLLLLGMYAGVWRYAGSRDVLRAFVAIGVSGIAALGIVVLTQGPLGDFSPSVFVIDFLVCSLAIVAARFAERAILRGLEIARHRTNRRVLIVGAGRTGRSLLRELRETPGERVVAFVDDDPALRGRRLGGVRVAGGSGAIEPLLERLAPDVVFVTIPDAPQERLERIVRACSSREVTCRFVTRDADVDPRVVLATKSP